MVPTLLCTDKEQSCESLSISFEQYQDALKAIRKPSEQSPVKTPWYRYLFLAILCLSIGIAIQTLPLRESLVDLVILALVLATLWGYCKINVKTCLKKVYEAQEKQLNGQQMEILEAGISGQTADSNISYHYNWSAFERTIELPDALLFLPNSQTFVRVPKASLNSDEVQEMMRWAASKPA